MTNDLIQHRSTLVAPGSKVAPATKAGISDLLAAFSTNLTRNDETRITLQRLYLEAVDGFAPEVAVAALNRLVLNNPRNPWHPTPQDVRDACQRAAVEQHQAYLATLGPRLCAARGEAMRRNRWVPMPEADLIEAAKQIIAEEDAAQSEAARHAASVAAQLATAALRAIPAMPAAESDDEDDGTRIYPSAAEERLPRPSVENRYSGLADMGNLKASDGAALEATLRHRMGLPPAPETAPGSPRTATAPSPTQTPSEPAEATGRPPRAAAGAFQP